MIKGQNLSTECNVIYDSEREIRDYMAACSYFDEAAEHVHVSICGSFTFQIVTAAKILTLAYRRNCCDALQIFAEVLSRLIKKKVKIIVIERRD